ncbi:MAG: dCTP deaminase [Ignavibacteria bacterium]|jgi:dCTP deaminase|nr:dCTP deaminase [Ignavibacteria bacterium]
MILSDKKILEEIATGNIVIEPFEQENLGTNSYDVRLGRWLSVYEDDILDAKENNEIVTFEIPDYGYILLPSKLYLGVTHEYTETRNFVPFLEGKSSVGRLGIDIHATAGKGDEGFCNTWTLEISVKQPVKIYKFMPIGQLIYFEISGEIVTHYNSKPNAKYNEKTVYPVKSMMYRNFK